MPLPSPSIAPPPLHLPSLVVEGHVIASSYASNERRIGTNKYFMFSMGVRVVG